MNWRGIADFRSPADNLWNLYSMLAFPNDVTTCRFVDQTRPARTARSRRFWLQPASLHSQLGIVLTCTGSIRCLLEADVPELAP